MSKFHQVQLTIFLVCVVSTLCNTGRAEEHATVAKFLPRSTAVYCSIQNPSRTVDELSELCGVPDEQIYTLLRQVTQTNPSDGTQRNFSGTGLDSTDLDFEFNVNSIHFVLTNSREELGNAALLIDRGDNRRPIKKEFISLMIRVVSQAYFSRSSLLRSNVDVSKTGIALSQWEDSLEAIEFGDWIVFASNKSFANALENRFENPSSFKDSLASSNAFKASLRHNLKDHFFAGYLSYRKAKQVMLAFGNANEQHWKDFFLDNIPWVSTSVRLSNNGTTWGIDRKRVVAATVPSTGESTFWKLYQPIKTFCAVPDGVDIARGKCLKLEQWNNLTRDSYPGIKDTELYDIYAKNPLVAYETGISRPRLGSLQFEFWDMKKGESLKILEVEAGTEDSVIFNYLDKFYTAVDEGSRRNQYITKHRRTEILGNPAWWTDSIKKSDTLASRPMNSNERESDKQTLSENELSDGSGAIFFNGWVAQGQLSILEPLVDSDDSTRLRMADIETEKVVSRAMSIFNMDNVHYFEICRHDAIQSEWETFLDQVLSHAIPVGWSTRTNLLDEAMKNEKVYNKLIPLHKFRIEFRKIFAQLGALQPSCIEVESINNDCTRRIYGKSYRFKSR